MNVEFFEKQGVLDPKAIEAGIYQFKIGLNISNFNGYKSLYIGESYSMVVRCSNHLYEIFHNDSTYFGLTPDQLNNNKLKLVVEVCTSVDIPNGATNSDRDVILREEERKAIEENKPLSQFETSDNLRKDRVAVVGDAIEKLLQFYN